MLYINDHNTDPYWNLAAEEYLLKEFTEPVFRLWRNENSIIIGQYQNAIAEIDTSYVKDHDIKVVRRLTGGGAVFHDLGNLNYTFIEQKNSTEDASAMFKRFTAPIVDALNAIGIQAYLHGRNDLLIDEKKFSGNAICIHKNRILQHGTLLFSASMNNLGAALKSRPQKFIGKAVQSNRSRVTNISEHIPKTDCPVTDIISFKEYLAQFISSRQNITPYIYTDKDLKAIETLRIEKYSKDEWNFGKSPSYSYSKTTKFPGGLVEISMNISKGEIKELQINGDYFFTRPTEEFVSSMTGIPHTTDAICNALEKLDINSYFNNITKEEIATLFFI